MSSSVPITQASLDQSLERAFLKFGTEFRKVIREDIKIEIRKSADDILEVLQGFIGDVDERFNALEAKFDMKFDMMDKKFDRQNEKNDSKFTTIETDVKLLKKVSVA